MVIYACPQCGSKKIRQGALHVGALTGSKQVCRMCNYQGMPLIFDTDREYQQFLYELRSDSKIIADPVPLTKNEQDIIAYAKEPSLSDESRQIDKKPYGLLILVGVTFLYSLFLLPSVVMIFLYVLTASIQSLIEWYRLIFLMSCLVCLIIIPYGFIRRKNWAYFLSGLLFIMALPVGLIFLYYLTRPHVKAYFHID